jgi:hypothetical protein
MIRMRPTVWIFALMTSISVASTLSVPKQSNPPEQNHSVTTPNTSGIGHRTRHSILVYRNSVFLEIIP